MKKVKLPLCPNPILNTCAHGRPIHLQTKRGVKHYLVCTRKECVYDEASRTMKKLLKQSKKWRKEISK